MPQYLPWVPLLSIPIALTYKHLMDPDDPAFGPQYYANLVDSFSIPNDAHGGSFSSAFVHVLPPYAAFALLYATASGKYDMNAQVKVEGVLKTCLRLHVGAFLMYSVMGELSPHVLAKLIGSPDLFHPDANTFVLRSALSDMFFVAAVMFWLMSVQKTVPRWTTWIPLIQSIYNLMNDVRWAQEGVVPGGKVVPYRLNIIDGGMFMTLCISYTYAYFNAVLVDDKKKN